MNKQCAICKQFKLTTEFHRNKRNKDGLHSYCKSCNALKAKEYQKTAKGKESLQKAIRKYQKTEKGKKSIRKAIKRKAVHGYYRFGKGAIPILRQGAKKRGIPFNLTSEDLEKWWLSTPDVCAYCGSSIEEYISLRDYILKYNGDEWEINKFKRFYRSSKHASIRWMTIDRIDNSSGYILSNIVKACWICNSLKSDFFTGDEMKRVALRVIGRLKTACSNNAKAELP